ncbi:MAG: hypothetical protein HRU25_04940, partial [Psychrobium sp.]|nr:hypothetical protein [Psychrobium sp.]
YDATSNILGVGSAAQINLHQKTLQQRQGWHITLNRSGEKILASSLTFDNAIWFTSFQPNISANSCTNQRGTSRLYRVNVSDAKPNYKKVLPTTLDNGGLDVSKTCTSVICDTSDRSIQLSHTTLPPRPTLLNIKGKKMIGIGTEFYPAENLKTSTLFWSEVQP